MVEMIAVNGGAALPRGLEGGALKGDAALTRGLEGGAPPMLARGTMGMRAVAGAVALMTAVQDAALE